MILTEAHDGWVRLRLNRPPHHSLTWELCSALAQAVERATHDPQVRAVVLDSTGPAFCSGADLKLAVADPAGYLSELVERAHAAVELLLLLPKPLITAATGVAAGGGLGFFLAGDVRLAHPSARFHLAYPRVGMSLDCSTSLRLPQLSRLTSRMLFEDYAPMAAEADFVSEVHEELEAAVVAWATRLARGATQSYAASKALLNPPDVVRRQLSLEAEAIKRMASTADGKAGIAAFLARQEPVFGGN